jgi:hypothetical protein
LLGEVVRHIGDGDLERRLGVPLMQRAIFAAMTRGYDPAAAQGFRGTIAFELTRPVTGGGSAAWIIEVLDGHAVARPGAPAADGVALTLRMPMADFLRVAGGVIDPAEPLLSGRATLVGDLGLAARLAEMFGAPRPRG